VEEKKNEESGFRVGLLNLKFSQIFKIKFPIEKMKK
jgi:hypothetical protein